MVETIVGCGTAVALAWAGVEGLKAMLNYRLERSGVRVHKRVDQARGTSLSPEPRWPEISGATSRSF